MFHKEKHRLPTAAWSLRAVLHQELLEERLLSFALLHWYSRRNRCISRGVCQRALLRWPMSPTLQIRQVFLEPRISSIHWRRWSLLRRPELWGEPPGGYLLNGNGYLQTGKLPFLKSETEWSDWPNKILPKPIRLLDSKLYQDGSGVHLKLLCRIFCWQLKLLSERWEDRSVSFLDYLAMEWS